MRSCSRRAKTGAGTSRRAVTYARFAGLHGRIYRALVIGSGGHALATRRMLRSIKRVAERPQSLTTR